MTTAPRFQIADELLRRLAASLRSAQLYSAGHPIISRNMESLSSALQLLHSLQPAVVIGIVGDEVIVDDMPMAKAETLGPLIKRLQQGGVERITIERGVTSDELSQMIDAIMQSIGMVRDERATPLFVYILGHVDHRRSLGVIYLRAIEQLGVLRDPSAIEPLRKALYKGEWWAPRRTAALRNAAAAALARIGTPEAFTVLDDAVAQGSRGVRSAARAQLATARRRDARDAAAREGSA